MHGSSVAFSLPSYHHRFVSFYNPARKTRSKSLKIASSFRRNEILQKWKMTNSGRPRVFCLLLLGIELDTLPARFLRMSPCLKSAMDESPVALWGWNEACVCIWFHEMRANPSSDVVGTTSELRGELFPTFAIWQFSNEPWLAFDKKKGKELRFVRP